MTRAQLNAIKQEMLDVRCGFEWEFANRVDPATNPGYARAVRRVAELHSLLQEHTAC